MTILRKDWAKHSAEFLKSGVSMRAYSREHNLTYETFRYWHRKLTVGENPPGGFIEVKLESQPLSLAPITVRVNGIDILVCKGVDRQHLLEVVCCLKEIKC